MNSQNTNQTSFGKVIFRMLALATLVVLIVMLFGPSPESFGITS